MKLSTRNRITVTGGMSFDILTMEDDLYEDMNTKLEDENTLLKDDIYLRTRNVSHEGRDFYKDLNTSLEHEIKVRTRAEI